MQKPVTSSAENQTKLLNTQFMIVVWAHVDTNIKQIRTNFQLKLDELPNKF